MFDKFAQAKAWADFHGFPWKMKNNHFFWQTCIQTGELWDENGKDKMKWHSRDFFETI